MYLCSVPEEYEYLMEDLPPGGRVLLDDGKFELILVGTEVDALVCRVVIIATQMLESMMQNEIP